MQGGSELPKLESQRKLKVWWEANAAQSDVSRFHRSWRASDAQPDSQAPEQAAARPKQVRLREGWH